MPKPSDERSQSIEIKSTGDVNAKVAGRGMNDNHRHSDWIIFASGIAAGIGLAVCLLICVVCLVYIAQALK